MGFGLREHVRQHSAEAVVGRVVGPQREDAAGPQPPGQGTHPGRPVERLVTGVQYLAGRMVDVEQDGVETAVRFCRVEGPALADTGEEVTVDEPAPRVTDQARPQRYEAALVPVDHFAEGVDHDQGTYPGVVEHRPCGAAEAEAADGHVQPGVRQRREAEAGECDLGRREEAGHEVLVAEFHLVHGVARHRVRRRRRLMSPIGVGFQSSSAKRALIPVPFLVP